MSVFVYQTFEIKQDKFREGIENLQEIKKYRNGNYNHKVEILTPITGLTTSMPFFQHTKVSPKWNCKTKKCSKMKNIKN